MSYPFDENDKVELEQKEYLPFGVHEVKLLGATSGETDSGKDFIELTVVSKDGIETNARVWFTGKASKYSFATLRQIVVHNAKTDADKEKARMAVESCKDSDELADLLNSKTTGGQLWVTKYYDPTRTYVNQDGETKRSINTNVYGYEPKPKPELMTDDDSPQKPPKTFAVSQDGSVDVNIPREW